MPSLITQDMQKGEAAPFGDGIQPKHVVLFTKIASHPFAQMFIIRAQMRVEYGAVIFWRVIRNRSMACGTNSRYVPEIISYPGGHTI